MKASICAILLLAAFASAETKNILVSNPEAASGQKAAEKGRKPCPQPSPCGPCWTPVWSGLGNDNYPTSWPLSDDSWFDGCTQAACPCPPGCPPPSRSRGCLPPPCPAPVYPPERPCPPCPRRCERLPCTYSNQEGPYYEKEQEWEGSIGADNSDYSNYDEEEQKEYENDGDYARQNGRY